jgi:hypothetical protein
MVVELKAKGLGERQIAEKLGIPRSTIGFDIRACKRAAATNMHLFFEQELPHEMELQLQNTNTLLRIAWDRLQEDMEKGKEPYRGIESIKGLLELREKFLEDKSEIAAFHKENAESKRVDFEEQAMREAYERERERSQRVF